LVAQLDLGIYGRIAVARLYRPATETQDLLFVCTERRRFFVLAYDKERQQVVTRANGDVNEMIGKPVDNEQIGIVDPDCRVLGLHLYEGLFKVIPLDPRTGVAREAFKVRLEELQVLDIQFLHGYARPTLAVLYEDMKENRHIKTYEVLTKSKDLADGAWSQSNIDPGTEMLVAVPAPFRGVLVLGTDSVAYVDGSKQGGSHVAIPTRCGIIRAAGQIDAHGMRWLLCDGFGGLHVLALQASQSPTTSSASTSPEATSFASDSTIVGLTMEYLGKTSIASSIAYLDNGVVFVGSSGGDSQLVNLLTDKDAETDSYIQVLETYTNLGPIVDFCVMDLKRQGQCQIVTCSGALTDGSLRLVRNGIGIDEQAAVDLPGIKGIWSLRKSFGSQWDSFLVQSFVGETRVLAIDDEEMGEHEIPGFDADVQTLFCGNMAGDVMVQITNAQVRLVYANAVADVWTPPGTQKRITVAAGNAKQIFIALGGGELVLLHVDLANSASPKLVQKASVTMDQEIACMDATPLTPPSNKAATTSKDSGDMEVEESSRYVLYLCFCLSVCKGDYDKRNLHCL
jgi:DNA damage-binding protein 1